MKRLLLFISFILTAFFTAGCLKVNTFITVNDDGSGTVEETVFMSKLVIDMFSQFTNAFTDDTTVTPEPFSLFNEDDMIKNAGRMGEGVTYVSGEKLSTETHEGYKAIYSFKDINKLRVNNNPASDIPLGDEDPAPQGEDQFLTFTFKKGTPSVLTVIVPPVPEAEDVAEETDNPDSEQDDMMNNPFIADMLKDMSVTISVKVNGSIVETDAAYVDDNVVTFLDLHFSELFKDQEKFKSLQNVKPGNMSEAREILKDIPGIKIEMNPVTTIKFR